MKQVKMAMNKKRIRALNTKIYSEGKVVYWMDREQRIGHNWALLYAIMMANKYEVSLTVIFSGQIFEPVPTLRQYSFALEGLKQLKKELNKKGVGFELLVENSIDKYIENEDVGVLVCDFSPLRSIRQKKSQLAKQLDIPVCEVDAHNIIPCWEASDKEEYSAFTFRKKLEVRLPEFLDDYPSLPQLKKRVEVSGETRWERIIENGQIDESVSPINGFLSGESIAIKIMNDFLEHNFAKYAGDRNNPNENVLSGLSPYLHFGQISAQYIASTVIRLMPEGENRNTFLDELIVRRELSDNFCYYNNNYDNFNGFREWAKKSLRKHMGDEREYIYSLEQFEKARTHDNLWNSAQHQIILTGKMHGYMRMYWAKKILEWSTSPDEAMKISTYLNDKYSLDGNDPNGYAGCAWSVGGVHDRPWMERAVFGQIRYMNYNGCKRKFDVNRYIMAINQIDA